MKIRTVQQAGARAEADGWTPWLYHAPEDEIERYYSAANALKAKLERMPPTVRARVKRVEFRCPVKGCLLARLYWVPRKPTVEDLNRSRRDFNTVGGHGKGQMAFPEIGTYLYVGRTPDGTEVYDIPFYGFSPTPKDDVRGCVCCRMVYWRAGCRHGTASLERNAMLDMFSLAERRHHICETQQEAFAKLPENLRVHWGKRVFHPDPLAWHAKIKNMSQYHASREDNRTPPIGALARDPK